MTLTTLAGSSNRNNITPPRVPFLDARTGLISREWFMWLLNIFARVNEGAEVTEMVDYLSVAPTFREEVGTDLFAQGGIGPVSFTPNPPTGALISLVESVSTTTQVIPNTDYIVTFDADTGADFGSVRRSGNHFYTSTPVRLVALVEPQLQQNTATSITHVWLTVDGVPMPGAGIVFEATSVNDSVSTAFTYTGIFRVSQILQLHATCSANNGSSLLFTAAAGFKPDIVSMKITLQGFSI